MKLILRRAHFFIYAGMFIALYYLWWPIVQYFSRKESRFPILNKVRSAGILLCSTLAGVFFKFEFEEKIDWSRNYIICMNHCSNLDIGALCVMVKNNYFFVGKDEVLDWQVIGHFFRTVDIPLNRASNISSYRAFKKAEARIKNGATLIIFPEGAISHEYPPVMVPFKNGPFRLAIEQKVPIIPVSSLNIWKIFFYDGMELGTRPGVVKIHTHKIIHTDNLTLDDVDALREQVYGIINEKIDPYIKATEHIETMPKSPYTY